MCLTPPEDKTNKEEQAPNPAPIIKDRDWPATVAVNKNSLLLPSKSPLYEYIEGPQMNGGPPLSGQTYRYGLAKCNSTDAPVAYNQYARLLPKTALDVLHQTWGCPWGAWSSWCGAWRSKGNKTLHVLEHEKC